MNPNDDLRLDARIDRLRLLTDESQGSTEYFEAASLAQSIVFDTIGGAHPIMTTLSNALSKSNWATAVAASRTVLALYDEGALVSPRLKIAHELEGGLLDIAESQIQAAEQSDDPAQKQIHIAIAAFLAGASLEDALRRLCDSQGIKYDTQRTSISKLQSSLYQPSDGIEIITSSENKQITAWGDTRNKADHGRFGDLTHSEVLTMVIGIRGFVDRKLP